MLPTSPHDAIVRVWLEPLPEHARWRRYLGTLVLMLLGFLVLLYWAPQG